MTCITRLDKSAKKVLSRGILAFAIVAVVLGVVLLSLWGVVSSIDGYCDWELFVVALAPVPCSVLLFGAYSRQVNGADGTLSYNEYDFGKVMFTVKATRRGAFAGTMDIEYSSVKKLKERGGYLLIYVRRMGAFIVDIAELGIYKAQLIADIKACIKGGNKQ